MEDSPELPGELEEAEQRLEHAILHGASEEALDMLLECVHALRVKYGYPPDGKKKDIT